MKTNLTPGPWSVIADSNCDHNADLNVGRKFSIVSADSEDRTYIAICEGDVFSDRGEANAKHIAACVNACAGLNPEQIPNIVSSLSYLEQQLDSSEPTAEANILTLRFTEEFRTAFKQMLAKLKAP